MIILCTLLNVKYKNKLTEEKKILIILLNIIIMIIMYSIKCEI